MKSLLSVVVFAFFTSLPLLAENYPDQVTAVTKESLQEYESFLAPYKAKAKLTLSYAAKRFKAGLQPGYKFFIITKISDGLGHFEQIFVRINDFDGEQYVGNVAVQTRPGMPYKHKDRISVAARDVVDWTIVSPTGAEEGNLCGKAMDAYNAGIIVFIFEYTSSGDGIISGAKLVSIQDKQKQELLEISRDSWVVKAIKALMEKQSGQRITDKKYTFVLFDVRKEQVADL